MGKETMSNDYGGLVTYSEAARQLMVSRSTIADLCIRLGIDPKKMSNGRAKGLDRHDMACLRRLLLPVGSRQA